MPDYRGQKPMPLHEDDFCALIDKVCSKLAAGSMWHSRSALYMCQGALRGFGRVHFEQAKKDNDCRLWLEKLSVDRLEHIPKICMDKMTEAASYAFNGAPGLKEHLKHWYSKEKHYAKILTETVEKAREVDIKIYEKLCHLLGEAQEEMFRVKTIVDRLDLAQWSAHDLAIVSKSLHEHMENGSNLDFTLS